MTTSIRLFAEIMRDERILPSGIFAETGRADPISDHAGEAAPLVRERAGKAHGGVLFIDEAYHLCDCPAPEIRHPSSRAPLTML